MNFLQEESKVGVKNLNELAAVLECAPKYYEMYVGTHLTLMQQRGELANNISFEDIEIAVILLKGDEIEFAWVNDVHVDFGIISDYLKTRRDQELQDSDPVVITQLLKSNEFGVALPPEKRGIIVDGVHYQLWLGIHGFPKAIHHSLVQAARDLFPFEGILWQLNGNRIAA